MRAMMWMCEEYGLVRIEVVMCEISDVFFLMILRPPKATQSRSSAASDVYKRQVPQAFGLAIPKPGVA